MEKIMFFIFFEPSFLNSIWLRWRRTLVQKIFIELLLEGKSVNKDLEESKRFYGL